MTSLVSFFRTCCAAAAVAALAACGASGSESPVPVANAQPSPPSASFADVTTQSIPPDGKLSFALAANRGLGGTIAFPLVPGASGTATLQSSAAAPGLPDLAGPPLAPEPVEYLCISFSVHQIPLGPPSLALTAAAVSPESTGVGLAYFQAPSNSWNQSYGVAALAPSVTIVARDAVFYRPDRTCFALYLTAVTPLP